MKFLGRILQFFQQDGRIQRVRFPAIFWVAVALFSLLIWWAWPIVVVSILAFFSESKIITAQTLPYLGQFGDMFGTLGALATAITLFILVVGKLEQNTIDDNLFIVSKVPILMDLVQKISSPEYEEAFYAIEYNNFSYDGTFHGSDIEKHIDRYLTHLDIVCLQYFRGVLNFSDMEYFDYRIYKAMSNHQIIYYFNAIRLLKSQNNITHLSNLSKYHKILERRHSSVQV